MGCGASTAKLRQEGMERTWNKHIRQKLFDGATDGNLGYVQECIERGDNLNYANEVREAMWGLFLVFTQEAPCLILSK